MLRQRGRQQPVPVATPAGGGGLPNVYALTSAHGDDRFPSTAGLADMPLIPETAVDSGIVKRVPSPASGFFSKKVKQKELMHFSRQLAAFLRAGVPILDALTMLADDIENPTFAAVVRDIEASLRQGNGLSDSLDAHPRAFPNAYRSMIRSAEVTGNLDTVLDRLSAYLERDTEARDKVKAALTYPAVIGVLSVGVVVLLTTFVLPKFRPFFKSFHKTLPLPTRMLINFADFMSHLWWLVLLLIAAVVASVITFVRHRTTRPMWDRFKLRVPILGDVFRYAVVERFCRVLSSMLSASVPVSEALRIAADASQNLFVRRELDAARTLTMQGAGVAAPLSHVWVFPSAAIQMIRVGEATGSLDRQLEQAAVFFERELDYKIKRFTTVFEPAIIIGMGLVVGFVAIALVSAMYGVFQNANIAGQ
jgi:type IV pilus assembly protein PilC